MTEQEIVKAKPKQKIYIGETCPCPNYRGKTVLFKKIFPTGSSHFFADFHDEEDILFRTKDASFLE